MTDDVIFDTPNDLVVPFDGTIGFDTTLKVNEPLRVRSFGSAAAGQNVVHHNNFFSQTDVAELLMEELHA